MALYTNSETNELLDAFSWRLLLPELESPRVLSVWPPDSAHLHALATLFENVASVEAVTVGEHVTAHAKYVNGPRSNASASALPFDNTGFDLVIVNVRGRSGDATDDDPQTYYEAVFANLYGILKDNGCICLCLPNRWDYRKFLAGPKSVPSRSSGIVSALFHLYRRQKYHFLSPKRYSIALHAAGFSDLQSYVAFPDCSKPRFVVPFEVGTYRYYRSHFTCPEGSGIKTLAAKLIAGSGLDRFLESHLLITGVKC